MKGRRRERTPYPGETRRKEAITAPTDSSVEAQVHAFVEAQVRAFAAKFDTPNTRRAVALAESGRLTWEQVYGVFHNALSTGLVEVRGSE